VLELASLSSSELVTVFAALVGGAGLAPLWLFLARRKPELTKMDRESAAAVVEAGSDLVDSGAGLLAEHRAWATMQIARLEEAEKRNLTQIKELQERLDSEARRYKQGLEIAHREHERLSIETALLRTDLDIARRQVVRLTRQLNPK
jgi:hypothetical protein